MSTTDARPPEQVIARIRRHARALFWPTLLLMAAAGAAGYFGFSLRADWAPPAIWGGLAVVAVFGWLLPFLWWLGQRSTITTRRVIVRSGFLVRVRQEVLYTRIYDVSVRRGVLQSAFRSGDVRINVGSDRPIVLRDIPTADLVQRTLHDLADAAHAGQPSMQWASAPTDAVDATVAWGGR